MQKLTHITDAKTQKKEVQGHREIKAHVVTGTVWLCTRELFRSLSSTIGSLAILEDYQEAQTSTIWLLSP